MPLHLESNPQHLSGAGQEPSANRLVQRSLGLETANLEKQRWSDAGVSRIVVHHLDDFFLVRAGGSNHGTTVPGSQRVGRVSSSVSHDSNLFQSSVLSGSKCWSMGRMRQNLTETWSTTQISKARIGMPSRSICVVERSKSATDRSDTIPIRCPQ
jgi:hypothetical protein